MSTYRDIHSSVRNAYNNICEKWFEVRGGMVINRCIEDFAKLLAPDSDILDVGCGTGYPIGDYLAKCGFNVTGIDISERMIEKARSANIPNSRFMVCDFLDFTSDKKFNAVIAFDSIWHISHDLQHEIYPRLASLLKSGGRLLFTHGKRDGFVIGEMFGEKFYHSALDADYVVSLLRDNGFEIVDLLTDYIEPTTGDRELLITAKKK